MAIRCVYTDLDGTLLGPRGALVRNAEGGFTLLPVRALEACARAEAEVVPISGRRPGGGGGGGGGGGPPPGRAGGAFSRSPPPLRPARVRVRGRLRRGDR